MRIPISIVVVGWLAVLPVGLEWSVAPAWSQTPPSAQKPPTQPPPTTTPTPTPTTAAEPQQSQEKPPPDEAAESARSLFSSAGNQAQISGRWTSVAGDPARFQRYQDLGSGLLFTDARYGRETDDWVYRIGADNVGWRDQRFFGTYERTGKFVFSGLWDQIPQFYSVDTRTPYSPAPGVSPLTLDDAIQRSIQTGQADRNAYVPVATQFNLRERRDIGNFAAVATPTKALDLKAAFTTTRHTGELPWGASFGFSNDVEVALPYDSRTNDLSLGAEWAYSRGMVRVAYDGSWFDNLDDTLVWDSPLSLDDTASLPGHGRMALWPSNTSQTVSAAASAKLAARTQLTGFVSYGVRSNDEPLQPFTINPALTQLALPRSTTEGEANVFSANFNLVSRPATDWRFSARLRRYDYDNQAPHAAIPQFINYDTSVTTSSTGGPELFAHSRTTFDADATWSGLLALALTAGYTHNSGGYDFRIFESTGEDVLTLKADTVAWQWATIRAHYELSDRSGSGLDEHLLTEIGEQPALRHYDVANRKRQQLTGQVDVTPSEALTLSASFGVGNDDYKESYFGLQESSFRVFTLSADYQHPTGIGVGGSYDYERYSGLQRSRSASPGQTPDQVTDPNRDWTADSRERVNFFTIYVTPPRIGKNTEARFSYNYSHARSDYVYGVVPGGPLPPPSQLPEVFNKLQELQLDIRHRLSNRLVATFSYLYEPFDVYDFAFDPSVVNGIVQPSSLVLGYVYRPYTANSAVFGLRYFW